MTTTLPGGTFTLADDLTVTRMGYGAMQLAGPHVFGPPRDRDAAVAVLRAVVDLGITHIDTSDYYGPYVTNEIIREALSPYPAPLSLVTKVGARRDEQGGWPPARTPAPAPQGPPPAATSRAAGRRPAPRPSCAGRSTTTSAASAWTPWTW